MIFLYCLLGSIVGTLIANASIVIFGVFLKNKKGGGLNGKKNKKGGGLNGKKN